MYSHRGIPVAIVRHLVSQALVALDFLHSDCQIVHTGEPARLLSMLASGARRRGCAAPTGLCLECKRGQPCACPPPLLPADLKPENVMLTEPVHPERRGGILLPDQLTEVRWEDPWACCDPCTVTSAPVRCAIQETNLLQLTPSACCPAGGGAGAGAAVAKHGLQDC